MLRLVGVVGYISTEQLARELFPNVDRARRRLRQLCDARYIRVTVTGSRAQNLVSLTPSGRDALEAALGGEVDGLQLPGPIALASVRHHLAVVDMRLALAALRDAGIGELIAWHGGRSRRADEAGFATAKLAPDGLADVRLGNSTGLVAVEVDCATEGTRFLRAKLERYTSLLAVREKTELWLLAEGTASRVVAVSRLCEELGVARKTRLHRYADVVRRPFSFVPRLTTMLATSQSD